jgi:hypothetical protein
MTKGDGTASSPANATNTGVETTAVGENSSRSEKLLGGDINIAAYTAGTTLGVNGGDLDITRGIEEDIASITLARTGVDLTCGNALTGLNGKASTPCRAGSVQISTDYGSLIGE